MNFILRLHFHLFLQIVLSKRRGEYLKSRNQAVSFLPFLPAIDASSYPNILPVFSKELFEGKGGNATAGWNSTLFNFRRKKTIGIPGAKFWIHDVAIILEYCKTLNNWNWIRWESCWQHIFSLSGIPNCFLPSKVKKSWISSCSCISHLFLQIVLFEKKDRIFGYEEASIADRYDTAWFRLFKYSFRLFLNSQPPFQIFRMWWRESFEKTERIFEKFASGYIFSVRIRNF